MSLEFLDYWDIWLGLGVIFFVEGFFFVRKGGVVEMKEFNRVFFILFLWFYLDFRYIIVRIKIIWRYVVILRF